jgi:outer membrane protein assembly factor BamB
VGFTSEEHRTMHIARVNADAIDDLLMLGRFYGDSDSRVHLVAIDGATGKRIWKSIDFGSVGDNNAHTRTRTAVQGANIVVTDYRASARILELASGRELRSITLSDIGKAICPDPSDANKVWIEVADGKHVNLTLADAKLSASKKRPAGCPDLRGPHASSCRDHVGSATCSFERIAPRGGMRIETVLSADDQRIGLGRKYPGTAVPMVAGLAGKKTSWSRRLVEDVNQEVTSSPSKLSDLAAGRLFIAYELANDDHRLVAIDAKSGSNIWDVAIPAAGRRGPRLETMAASPSHLFIGANEHLFIFDAATGKLIAGAATD